MLKLLRRLALCLAPLSFVAPLGAQTLPAGVAAVRSVEGIDEYRLANGLQVLLVPDDSKPTTTVNLTYRVGSRHENYGETGMAHLLEHLLFKGSPKHPQRVGRVHQARPGGQRHAPVSTAPTTSPASPPTTTTCSGPGLEADHGQQLHRTRGPRHRDDGGPQRDGERREQPQSHPDAAHDRRPTGTPTASHIGARSDVENVNIPRLQAFYRCTTSRTMPAARRRQVRPAARCSWTAASFGPIPKPTRICRRCTPSTAQDGERRSPSGAAAVRRSAGRPTTCRGLASRLAAVEMLALVLGDTPTGRLHKQPAETSSPPAPLPLPGRWPTRRAVPRCPGPKKDVDKARDALLAVGESSPRTDRRRRTGARPHPVAQAVGQTFTDPENVGLALSEAIAMGDWRLFFLERDQVQQVTLADVRAWPRPICEPANRTLGLYLSTDAPQPRRPRPRPTWPPRCRPSSRAAVATVAAFDATPAHIDARTQRFGPAG